jgi:hypothetical protein
MQSDDISELTFSEKSYRVRRGDALKLRLSLTAKVPLKIGRVEFTLTGLSEVPCCRSIVNDANLDLSDGGRGWEILIDIPNVQLSDGRYNVLLGLYDREAKGMYFYSRFEIGVVVYSDAPDKTLADGELFYSPDLDLALSENK